MNQRMYKLHSKNVFPLQIGTTNETATETTTTTMEPSKLSLTNMKRNKMFFFMFI